MFKQQTVLSISDLPTVIKACAYEAYRDIIQGNESYIWVSPSYILDEQGILSLEDFKENVYDCEESMYYFLKWCVEQGQTEDFILLYSW